jgi:hypothetical protein
MTTFIKFVSTILGGVLAGFGIGLLIEKSGGLTIQYRDAALALSLIAGGFFVALGIPSRATDKDIIDSQPPTQPQQ